MTPDELTAAQCQSFKYGSLICRDGFPHRAFCRTGQGYLPHCLNDNYAPKHLIDETGRPRFSDFAKEPTT